MELAPAGHRVEAYRRQSLRNLDAFGADLYVALMARGVAWLEPDTPRAVRPVREASEPPERRAVWTRRRSVLPAADAAAAGCACSCTRGASISRWPRASAPIRSRIGRCEPGS